MHCLKKIVINTYRKQKIANCIVSWLWRYIPSFWLSFNFLADRWHRAHGSGPRKDIPAKSSADAAGRGCSVASSSQRKEQDQAAGGPYRWRYSTTAHQILHFIFLIKWSNVNVILKKTKLFCLSAVSQQVESTASTPPSYPSPSPSQTPVISTTPTPTPTPTPVQATPPVSAPQPPATMMPSAQPVFKVNVSK